MNILGARCMHCGAEYSFGREFEGCNACRTDEFSANLDVVYDFKGIDLLLNRDELTRKHQALGLAGYEDLLPISSAFPFHTLGAGATPLLRCPQLERSVAVGSLFLKDESRNPTASLKDRQAAVGGNVALQLGSQAMIAVGNMGAATAAFGARYGLPVLSFEDEAESPIAMLQVRAYGGKCIVVENRQNCFSLMKQAVDQFRCHPLTDYTESPTGDPYSQDGAKTIAYEICESLGWRAPDKVIMPIGKGLCMYGVWKGFREFYDLGFVDSLPVMIAAESSAGGSLSKSNLQHPTEILPVEPKPTVARHAVTPKASYKGLRALVDSGGFPVAVDDDEVLRATLTLARKEGVFASTTSSTTIAALMKLKEQGRISANDTIVCVISGGGLKDADIMENTLPEVPVASDASWSAFEDLLSEYYDFRLQES